MSSQVVAFYLAEMGQDIRQMTEGLLEECMHMLGMADRSLPMFFKHQLTYLPFCGSRNGCRLVTIATRG